MRRIMISSGALSRAVILTVTVILGLGAQAAQLSKSATPAPAVKPEPVRSVEAEPNSTLVSFGDWTLRCQHLGNGAEAQRVYGVTRQIRAQDQQNPTAELTIGRLKKTDPLRLTIVMAIKVTFSNPPSFLADGKALEPLDLGWRKCLLGGCIADAVLKDDVLRRSKVQVSARMGVIRAI
jgi:invasion protein IalB